MPSPDPNDLYAWTCRDCQRNHPGVRHHCPCRDDRQPRIDHAALVQVALGCGIDRDQAAQLADAMQALGWRR